MAVFQRLPERDRVNRLADRYNSQRSTSGDYYQPTSLGVTADKFGHRLMLLVSLFSGSLFILGYTWGTEFWYLIIMSILVAFFSSPAGPLLDSLALDFLEDIKKIILWAPALVGWDWLGSRGFCYWAILGGAGFALDIHLRLRDTVNRLVNRFTYA